MYIKALDCKGSEVSGVHAYGAQHATATTDGRKVWAMGYYLGGVGHATVHASVSVAVGAGGHNLQHPNSPRAPG